MAIINNSCLDIMSLSNDTERYFLRYEINWKAGEDGETIQANFTFLGSISISI